MIEGLADGAFGDLVEHHPAHPIIRQAKGLLQVPGDGLALAVGVGGEVDQGGLAGLLLEVGDGRFLAVGHDVSGPVMVEYVDSEVAPTLGQVADVAHAGLHHVAGAEELVDRFRLLGALHNDQHLAASGVRTIGPGRRSGGAGGGGSGFLGGTRLRAFGAGSRLRLRRLGSLSGHGSILFLSCCTSAGSAGKRGRPRGGWLDRFAVVWYVERGKLFVLRAGRQGPQRLSLS